MSTVRKQQAGDLLNVHGPVATRRGFTKYPWSGSRGLLNVHGQVASRRGFTRGFSRVICEWFLEALVKANGAEGAPFGGMPPPLKMNPQRCNLVHFETKR